MLATNASRPVSSLTEPFFSRNSNSANGPLPLIPRRVSSGFRSRSAPPSPPVISLVSAQMKVIIQHSSPPQEVAQPSIPSPLSDSDSSSSSGASEKPRRSISLGGGRSQRTRLLVWPPEQSTPTPAVYNARLAQENHRSQKPAQEKDEDNTPRPRSRPLLYVPGTPLRVRTEGLKSRKFSESRVRASTESPTSTLSSPQLRLVRKKSGQLVKSSLKSSKSLSVITPGVASKSEPTTPTHTKFVHFDSQLEHVKLFLAEQKPLAVSRNGSPTEDTSGTDNDFPSFVFGNSDDGKPWKTLTMKLLNQPIKAHLNSDVVLEELVLSPNGTNLFGRVRVRNIAYAKWLTIRFTFDSWRTTSEVTGRYVESIDSNFDRFSFGIRLNDLLARIEEKKLYFAIRYLVGGRELWDNNGGNNYLVAFSKVAPAMDKTKIKMNETDEFTEKNDMASLKSKLEKVAGKRQSSDPSLLAQSLDRGGGQVPRYSFGMLSNESRKLSESSPIPRIQTRSYPATPTPNSVPWPEKTKNKDIPIITLTSQLGSPRDADEDSLLPIPLPSDLRAEPFPLGRNHRRGHFSDDTFITDGSTIQRMPPGETSHLPSLEVTTPPSLTRFHSFPLAEGLRSTPPYGLGFKASVYLDSSEGSDHSTPSFTSTSSSSSPSVASSPSGSISDYPFPRDFDGRARAGISPGNNYHQFLNKFCFFTGSDGTRHLNVPSDPIPRTQSASDIEDFLSGSSHLCASDGFYPTTPTRSPSFDDVQGVGARSGSLTPTPHHLMPSSPHTPTPISLSLATVPGSQSATPVTTA